MINLVAIVSGKVVPMVRYKFSLHILCATPYFFLPVYNQTVRFQITSYTLT